MKTINSIHSNLNQQPRKKKPFINKKNSVTFHVVHRSQRDPLAADDSANQHVLLEAPKPSNDKVLIHGSSLLDTDSNSIQ